MAPASAQSSRPPLSPSRTRQSSAARVPEPPVSTRPALDDPNPVRLTLGTQESRLHLLGLPAKVFSVLGFPYLLKHLRALASARFASVSIAISHQRFSAGAESTRI
jgi:hypothetical protein